MSRFPLFRTQAQQRLLQALAYSDVPLSLTEIATRAETEVSTIQREIEKLEAAGVVRSHRVGRQRLVALDVTSALHRPLLDLVLATSGAKPLLKQQLAGVAGIERAFIYGSWAARELGRAQASPRDVDVMIVGAPDPHLLDERCRVVEKLLGVEVNPTIVSPREWREASSGFLRTVKDGPRVRVLP